MSWPTSTFSHISGGAWVMLIISLLTGLFMSLPNTALAAVITWDNGGGDGLWSTCTNWSADICPGSGDTATFDGTSTANSEIDALFGGTVGAVDINTGYTGTISQSRALILGSYNQAAGTFTQGDFGFDGGDNSFTLSGGVFNTGSSSVNQFERNFTVSGGTYNASSTAILQLDDNLSNDYSTLTYPGTFPNLVNIVKDQGGDFTVPSGTTVNTVNAITNGGDIFVNSGGTLNMGSSTPIKSMTVDGTVTVKDGLNTNDGSITVNNGGSFTYNGSQINIDRNLTVGSTATFNVGSGVLFVFDGNLSNDDTTLSYTGTFPYLVDLDKYIGGAFTLPSGLTVNTVNSLTGRADINVNSGATLNMGSSTPVYNVTVSGTLTIKDGLDTYDGSVTVNDGGSFTYNGSQINIERNLTVGSTATFNVDTGAIFVFDGGLSTDDSTLTYTGTFPNLVNISKVAGGAFTVPSGTTVNTVNSLTGRGDIYVNSGATLNMGSSTPIANLTVSGTVTVKDGLDMADGSLTVNNGGSFTYNGTHIYIERNITIGETATLNVSGVTFVSDANLSTDDTTFSCSGTFPTGVDIAKGVSGAVFSLASGCTINLGDNASTASGVTINGTLDVSGFNLSGAVTVNDGGTLRLQGAETATTPTLATGSTVEYDGTGTYTSLPIGTSYKSLAFSGSGSWSIASALAVAENFQHTAGTLNLTGTTTLSGTSAYVATTSANTNLTNLAISGTISLAGSGLDLAGNLSIGSSATLDASAASCSSAACGINIAGNWSNSGTFTARTGTVTFDGTGQTISGDNTFYNLTKTVSAADTLTLTANSTQTITNTWTMTGTAGNLLSLRSSSAGTQWNIDPQGTRTIEYLDAKDSNNTNASAISVAGLNVTDSGNNTNWSFNSTPTVSSLGPNNYVNGSWRTDTTPTLTFTTADSDGDNVTYQIQIDDSSDFSSPVVDYTSASAAAGSASFTVGQATSSGTYTSGYAGQSLSGGSYYWRVLVNDGTVSSSYSTANSGAIAFKLDNSSPTTGSLSFSSVTTSTITASVSGASDSGAGLASSPYRWYESVTASSTGATTSTSWTVSNLSPNTEYTFTVGVTDMAANSASTTATSTYTLANPPSTASASADSSSAVTLVWGSNSNPSGTEYYAENVTAGTNSGWITTTSWTSSSLSAETSYTFRVKARNGNSVETASTTAAVATGAAAASDNQSSGGGGSRRHNKEKEETSPISLPALVKKLFPTHPSYSIVSGPEEISQGTIVTLTVNTKSFIGLPVNAGGDTVTIEVSGANPSYPTVVDNGDGTYTARYFAHNPGADIVTAKVNGVLIGKDSDNIDDGIMHVGVRRTDNQTVAGVAEELVMEPEVIDNTTYSDNDFSAPTVNSEVATTIKGKDLAEQNNPTNQTAPKQMLEKFVRSTVSSVSTFTTSSLSLISTAASGVNNVLVGLWKTYLVYTPLLSR